MQHTTRPKNLILIMLLAMSGCDPTAIQIAREAANRQAQQNAVMGKIVDADAHAHEQIIGVHRDLQAERGQLNTGWNKLEEERHVIASERRTESLLASVTKLAGGGFLLVMLLALCWLILFSARHDYPQAELQELVLTELVGQEPKLGIGGSQPLLTRAETQVGQR